MCKLESRKSRKKNPATLDLVWEQQQRGTAAADVKAGAAGAARNSGDTEIHNSWGKG